MKKRYLFIVLMFIVSMTSTALANWNYESFTTITDSGNKYVNDAYSSDLNTGTYAYVKPTDATSNYLVFSQNNKDFGGVRFYVSIDLSTNPSVLVQYDIGSGYTTIYNGVATANTWVYAYTTDVECSEDVSVRILLNTATGREFRIYEMQLLDYYNNPPLTLSQYTNYPFGSGCYGLCPEITVTIKDNDAGDTSLLELYGSTDDTTYTLLGRNDSGESVAQVIYDGCYYNRYDTLYYLKICKTDNKTICGIEWVNHTSSFTILPCVLDESDSNDTLPYDWDSDCWEMVSIPCNVSKYFVMIYNTSDSSWQTWNDSKGTGHYDGVFWWNSTTMDYDNLTDFEIYNGYWVYFYDHNLTVRYNCTCECECNSTALTKYENIVNATGTLESVYDSVTGWRVWANYTGNDTSPGPWNYSQMLLWKILNETSTTVLKLSTDGNLAIAGSLYTNTNSPPPGNTVIYQLNNSLWLTESGDLYIKGENYEESRILFYNSIATVTGIIIYLGIIYRQHKKRKHLSTPL